MDTKILEEIGLTKGEIQVYLTLLELGPSTAGMVLEKAKIQNSVFHFNVNRLIEKGLVSYIKKGKIRIYRAADPGGIISYLKDKEQQIQNVLPELKARQKLAKERQEAELFTGIRGIVTLLNTMIEDAKKGDEYYFFAADVPGKNKEIQMVYERYDTKRKVKGLVVKGIAPTRLKPLLEHRTYLKMKYTDLPVPANQSFCNEWMGLFSWGEKPVGVLIRAKPLVEKQKEFFKALWERL